MPLIKILFFAKAKDLIKQSEAEIDLPSAELTVNQLFEAIEHQWPDLQKFKRTFALALNEEYLDLDSTVTLQPQDTLAVIPPISGG